MDRQHAGHTLKKAYKTSLFRVVFFSIQNSTEIDCIINSLLSHGIYACAQDALSIDWREIRSHRYIFIFWHDAITILENLHREIRDKRLYSVTSIFYVRNWCADQISDILDAGADIVFPCIKVNVIRSCISMLVRNSNVEQIETIRHLVFDRSAGKVYVDDRLVRLTDKQYRLILLLLSDIGNVFSKEEIISSVWKDIPDGSRTLAVHISDLRILLALNHDTGVIVRSHYGHGYSISLE